MRASLDPSNNVGNRNLTYDVTNSGTIDPRTENAVGDASDDRTDNAGSKLSYGTHGMELRRNIVRVMLDNI